MRNTAILLLCALFFTYSCNKNHETPDSSVGSGTVLANVDGRAWASLTSVGGATFVNVLGTTTLTATAADGSVLVLAVPSSITLGKEYTVANGTLDAQYRSDANASVVHAAVGSFGSGTVVFSEATTRRMKGTFQFTGVSNGLPDLIVTDGTFDIRE